jgi:hypothetical protein
VTEYPVFIPCGEEHLAAVISVPDGPPRGVVVITGVPGGPRSHRHQVWSQAAERLVAIGVASVRWDLHGLYDSTGSAPEVDMRTSLVEEALCVARFAQRATGVDTLATAGNCLAAQTGLALTAVLPESVAAVCVLPPVLGEGAVRRGVGHAVRPKSWMGWVRTRPIVRRLTRTAGGIGHHVRAPLMQPLAPALGHAAVLFLYDEKHLASRSRAFPKVRRLVGRASADQQARFDLRVLPVQGLDRFGTVASQEATVDALVEWVDQWLPAGVTPSPAARSR